MYLFFFSVYLLGSGSAWKLMRIRNTVMNTGIMQAGRRQWHAPLYIKRCRSSAGPVHRYDSLRQVISVISTFLPNGWNWITVWDVGFLDSELLHRQFGVRTATLFSIEISGWNSDRNHYVRRAIIGFSVLHTLVPCMNVSQMVIF